MRPSYFSTPSRARGAVLTWHMIPQERWHMSGTGPKCTTTDTQFLKKAGEAELQISCVVSSNMCTYAKRGKLECQLLHAYQASVASAASAA